MMRMMDDEDDACMRGDPYCDGPFQTVPLVVIRLTLCTIHETNTIYINYGSRVRVWFMDLRTANELALCVRAKHRT